MKKDKKLILFINTTISGEISVRVFGGTKKMEMKVSGKSDKILILANKILVKNKIKLGDLGGIAVLSGPGSFTALRQGIVAANTLSFALGVPAFGVRTDEFSNDDELITVINKKFKKTKTGEIVLPFYGGEPNITRQRN
jgi:tRNA A37 threonylcarbamoyladenosine modification protein TsaB